MGDEQQAGGSAGNSQGQQAGERVEFRFDEQMKGSLESGLGALQQVFAGFAKMAQNVVGTEVVKNLQVGVWLGSVADCLDAIAASGKVTGSQAGELTCYSERLADELAGSKFAAQIPAFSKRLEAAVTAVEIGLSNAGCVPAESMTAIATTAGYFRASAKSVISISTSGSSEK